MRRWEFLSLRWQLFEDTALCYQLTDMAQKWEWNCHDEDMNHETFESPLSNWKCFAVHCLGTKPWKRYIYVNASTDSLSISEMHLSQTRSIITSCRLAASS